jgi:hypothetical protein
VKFVDAQERKIPEFNVCNDLASSNLLERRTLSPAPI